MNSPEVVEAFDEEFFWYVDQADQWLRQLGFETEIKRFLIYPGGLPLRNLHNGLTAVAPKIARNL
jgi:hypothetical protein